MGTINLATESSVSLREAAQLLPRGRRGRPVHLSCILRWILKGAKGPDGRLVRLEGLRVGGRWITSKEALQRFCEALTPNLADPTSSPRTPGQRSRASERAAKALKDLGI